MKCKKYLVAILNIENKLVNYTTQQNQCQKGFHELQKLHTNICKLVIQRFYSYIHHIIRLFELENRCI